MEIDTQATFAAAAIGIGATLVMDLWNLFLKRAFGVASLDLCLLGRWLLHMPGGTFRHDGIADASAKPLECAAGRIAHYSIGVGLAMAMVLVVGRGWLDHPTPLPALLFGIVTVIFPYFILQPSFGLGVAARKARNPAQARLKSFMSHAVFGIGLYLCALGRLHLVASSR